MSRLIGLGLVAVAALTMVLPVPGARIGAVVLLGVGVWKLAKG